MMPTPTPTPSPSPATRRLPWLAGSALVLAGVLAVAYLAMDRDPAPTNLAPPAKVQPPVEERSPAPRPAPTAGQEPGPAAVAPVAPAVPALPDPGAPELPPTAVSPVPEENPEILPEAPQTPEWRLEKTELIAGSLGKRVARLEAEIREAEARGDREGAAARRVLLERSRQRVVELEREIASLREQVRADGGVAP